MGEKKSTDIQNTTLMSGNTKETAINLIGSDDEGDDRSGMIIGYILLKLIYRRVYCR